MKYQDLLDKCHLPFKYYEHEFLQGKYIYVRIQSTVLRLNSLGVPWSFDQGPVEITESASKTGQGKVQYDAVTYGQLSIEGMGSRGAPGASTNTDKDNAAKAAHSFALRKAGSLFGVSQYLMVNPAAETEFVNFMNSADLGDLNTLKKAVKLASEIDNMPPLHWITWHYKDNLESKSPTIAEMTTALTNAGRI